MIGKEGVVVEALATASGGLVAGCLAPTVRVVETALAPAAGEAGPLCGSRDMTDAVVAVVAGMLFCCASGTPCDPVTTTVNEVNDNTTNMVAVRVVVFVAVLVVVVFVNCFRGEAD